MTGFQARRARSIEILQRTGMRPGNYAPLLWRVLWRLGAEIPPPHYMPFAQTALLAAAWFGAAWGGFMWLSLWSRQGMAGLVAAGVSCAAGLSFGLSMAMYYRHGKRKYQLPDWRALG